MDDVYIVTGAGAGIGRATALELADRGARLMVNDLGVTVEGDEAGTSPAAETVAAIEAAGGTAIAHEGDVADPDYADALVADAAAAFGRVDGVVNFAGILRNAPLLEMDVEDFDAVVSVHLRGHFSLLRAAGRHWAGRDGERDPSFLCVSSRAAFGRAEEGNYAAAKAGILGLMRTAAREFDEHDVRVNALLPTATTRMTDYVYGEDDPTERDPSKVAPAVGFLLGDGASGITGCTVRIAEDTVGLVSDPEIARTGLKDGGWDVDSLEARFASEICAGEDLDRSGPTF
jgi:NAD(P)-dependent dehydrogenase (short-subunit alcohol dehydrogenase family)